MFLNSLGVGRFMAIALAVAALPALAAAQGVGAIGGNVVDSSGAALPGVTVALSNPGVIGGTQEAITDQRGTYEFTRLVPGTYSVRGSLLGFRTSVQEGIVVNADGTTRADIKLEIGSLEETIIVSGQAPLLDTTSALQQTVLTRDTLETLPARNNIWTIARTAPAVTMNKYDVGGSEMFQQSAPKVHGSSGAEGTYEIDGLDVSGGEGGVAMYFDSHAFEEINMRTSSAPAESAKGGVVTSMITRTGTNTFAGLYKFTGASSGMGSNNLTPELRSELLAAVPPRALAANPDIEPGSEILGMYDHSATLSGPIVPNKLWYSATTSVVSLDQYRLGSYNPDGTKVLDDNRMKNGQAKISWQLRPSRQLHLMYNFNKKEQLHRTGNATVDFTQSLATLRQRTISDLAQARWTSVLSRQMLLDIGGQLMKPSEVHGPQPELDPDAMATFDTILREHGGAVPTYFHRSSSRNIFQASLSLSPGSHDMKFGYRWMFRRGNSDRAYSLGPLAPFGIRANFRNGVPDSVNTYNTPLSFELYSRNNEWYVQDRWRVTRNLVMNLGLRLEKTYGWLDAMCQEQTPFIAGQCFPATEGAPDWTALSPRFNVIYDLGGDGTTAVKFTANRYNIPTGNNLVALMNPVRSTNDTRSWTDNGDRIPQLNELGPSTGFNIGTTNRLSDDLSWPYSTEVSVGVERRLPWNLVVGATYLNRQRRNEVGARNMAVPASSYVPLQVTEVSSGRQVTVYNQDPLLRGRFDTLFDNAPELNATFNGVDLTFNKRLSNRWMLMGGLSLGENVGDIYGGGAGGDLNNPNLQFRRGILEDDVPVMFKAFGLYELPYGVSVSGSFQHFTGFPEITTVLVGADSARLTQVSQSITVEPRGTTRLPDVNLADLSIRKLFNLGRGYSVEPILDIFNATNGGAIRFRTTQLGPTYGRASDMVRARLIKLGVNVKF